MKAYVRYFNRPHDLKLSHIHIVPLARGIWHVSCELNLRGFDIQSWGGSSCGDKGHTHETYFGDDGDIRAALILKPETEEEGNLSLICDRISKTTYRSVLVSSKVFSRKWDEYCKRRVK